MNRETLLESLAAVAESGYVALDESGESYIDFSIVRDGERLVVRMMV